MARSVDVGRSPSLARKSTGQALPADSIRIFVTKGKHTHISEFDKGNFPLRDEFSAYGWKHTTPSQLIALLYPSFPPLYRHAAARYSFKHIYVDASPKGLYRATDLVSFTARDLLHSLDPVADDASKSTADKMDMELDDAPDEQTKKGRKIDEKTLDEYGFVIGDLLSVSVWTPEPKVRPAGALASGPGSGNADPSGWGDRRESTRGGFGRDVPGARDSWGRGVPLPPQNSRGNHPDVAGGGSWRGGRGGYGRNGGGRGRSRSPGPRERDRREEGGRGGEVTGGWDRSPPRTGRVPWAKR